MSTIRSAVALLVVLGVRMPAQARLTATSSADDYADALMRSSFVFTGSVTRLHASTTPSVRPRANTVVVAIRPEIDTVFVVPKAARSLVGRSVTLILQRTDSLVVGSALVVFASLATADTSLGLREVDYIVDHGTSHDVYAARLRDAREVLARREWTAMVQRSAAVVVGTVDSVSRLVVPESLARTVRFEHAPRWMDATVRIDRVSKPDTLREGLRVHVLFPGSTDVAFADAPRLAPHARLLLGLQPLATMPAAYRGGVPRGVYYILDASEVRSPSDTSRFKRIR